MARRKLIWSRMAPAATILTRINGGNGGAVESQDLLQSYRTEAGITRGPVGLTVMRIRMQLQFFGDTVNDVVSYATGIGGLYYGIKVTDFADILSQEAAELPARGPQLDPHADWMAWGVCPMKALSTQVSPAIVAIGYCDVDVRAMRKIDELGQTLGLWLQGTQPTVGAAVQVRATTSVLLALP